MIIRTSHALKALNLGIMTLLLVACGGGGTSGPSSSTITGTASKGVLKNAIVAAYAVTSSGQKGDKIASTRTDTTGKYSLNVTGYSGPVFLELTTDSNTTMTCDILAGCGTGVSFGQSATLPADFTLSSVVPAANSCTDNCSITPFTHLAAQQAAASTGGYSKANIEASLTQVAALFNLPSLIATKPADITSATLDKNSEDAQRYALLNAAIGQAAGSVENIKTFLDNLQTERNLHHGELIITSSNSDQLDLEDILSAANEVANDPHIQISQIISTIIAQDLQEAQDPLTTPINQPTTPPEEFNASDLAKAKAFVNSTHEMLQSLRTIGDNADSIESQLQANYAPVKEILTAKADDFFIDRLPQLLNVASVIAGNTISECINIIYCTQTNIDTKINNKIQELLNTNFNNNFFEGYGIQSYATDGNSLGTNGIKATVSNSSTSTTVTLNGSFKLKQAYNYNCYWIQNITCQSFSIGQEVVYTLNNFKLLYPIVSVPQTTHAVSLLKDSKISSPGRYLSLGDNSGLEIKFSSPVSIEGLADTIDSGSEPEIPDSITFKLAKITLGATGTSVNFQGNLNFTLLKKSFPTAADPTKTSTSVLPTQAQLSGTFNGINGDAFTASLTLRVDPTKTPLIDETDETLIEDSTHFASGTLSLTTSLNIHFGNPAITRSATISADIAKNAFQGGTGALTITLDSHVLKLTTAVAGDNTTFTLSDRNNVSVSIDPDSEVDGIPLMVNNQQMGILTTIAELPVVRFIDNSLIAL